MGHFFISVGGLYLLLGLEAAAKVVGLFIRYFGIDTDANSFGYLASWSQGKDISELKGYLENINETASTLIKERAC